MPGMRSARRRRGPTRVVASMFSWLVLCAGHAELAAEPDSVWLARRWTTEQGLPQNSVTTLLQSRDGYLWIGTFGGLARFDGLRFATFDGSDGLGSSRILALAEDADGSLWIGTEDGGLWRRQGGRFAAWPGAGFDQTGVIWALLATEDSIWLGTFDGVLRLPRQGGEPVRFADHSGLPGLWVQSLARDRRGRLWAGTSAGPARLEGERFVAGAEPGPERVLPAGVEAWEGLSLALDPSDLAGWRAVIEDREGNVWLGTNAGGLLRLKRPLVRMLGAAEGLPAESMLPILEDRSGTTWLGGWCSGLFRSVGPAFEGGAFEPVPGPDGGTFGCVSALYEDRAGRLWVGTENLARLEKGLASWVVLAGELPGRRVSALVEDGAGAVWIGTPGGLARLAGGSLRAFREPDGLPNRDVRVLRVARDGALWVGTQRGVARGVSSPGGEVRFEPLAGPGAPTEPVRDLFEDEDGSMWLATYGGGLVRAWHDSSGSMSVARVTTEQGLPENFISRILPAAGGSADGDQLWLCGNHGIHRIERSALVAVAEGSRSRLVGLSLGSGDGLRVAECNGGGHPAGWRKQDGWLWFPTLRGIATLDPKDQRTTAPPPVAIEGVYVDGAEVSLAKRITIPAGSSHLEIDFTALSFVGSESIRFRYRLAGFESAWQDSGTRRTAFYTRVPPGAYRFQVVAASRGEEFPQDGGDDGAGHRPPDGAELRLAFAPRLYQTLWFRGGLLAALMGAPLLLHRLRTARLRARERVLAAKVEVATAELAAARRRAEAQVVELEVKEAELAGLNRDLEDRVSAQTAELRETRDVAVITLAKLAELRDGATGRHLERIASFSRMIAERMRERSLAAVPSEFVDQLFRSSPLHDIGKVAIPDAILRKADRLTADERAIMETHTTIGGDTLRSVIERYDSHSFLVMGMDIAYAHHERWDGTGYPRQLAGEAIPLAARIVGLVDAYDAVTSQRSYKPAWPHEEAVRRIVADRGTHFDPELVDLFLAIEAELGELAERLRPEAG